MAGRTTFFWISISLAIIGTNAGGEFSVLHSPDSLSFSKSKAVSESLLKEIYSASLGLSVEENVEWDGLSINDPFNTPEAVVEVYIDGVSSLGNTVKSTNIALTVDEYEPDMYKTVTHRIKQRFSNGANNLVYIKLSDDNELTFYSDVFGQISKPKGTKRSLKHLKYTIEEDNQFLSELEALNVIAAKVKSGIIKPDNVVDFYKFRFTSLHALSDFHGPDSLQTKEAKKLLGEALEALSSAFVGAYEGSVLVAVVATNVAHTRRIRAAPEQNTIKATTDDDAYSQDYAAIFNIILWFGVVFVFSLIAIVYTIMDMDPGRDSIIYRMTSTRMKKDN